MLTKELFQKDPTSWTLANEGVSSNNDVDEATLRYELETFVCDGEYQLAMERILRGFLDRQGKEQAAAWVSGFYGSGKSHLVKVLRFLWTNYEFSDGSRARELANLPTDVNDLLAELSNAGTRGFGLHSAGGTLKAGSGDVRVRVLQVIFQSVDLPEKLNHARFVMDLRDEGQLDTITSAIEAAGSTLEKELGKLYTSKLLQNSYLAANPHLSTIENVSKNLREQYPSKDTSLTIEEMVNLIRRAIAPNNPKELPCTLLVLDEIQQYINDSAEVANDIQEVIEAVQKNLDGKVLLAGTGQSALSDTPALSRIMGRFPTPMRTHLKDNDVEKVVRTVVLQKKSEHKDTINQLVTKHSGEITRQLNATKIASTTGDSEDYVPDFPMLPVRRRFWSEVLKHSDSSGTTAQMRTQLRLTHDACRSVAEAEVGTVIPGDFIYDQLATDLIGTGELPKRFHEIIDTQKNHPENGPLRSRLCALIFLVNKLPTEHGDLGIRAQAEHLCDLLTTGLEGDQDQVRQLVPALLKSLHEESVLMETDGCYQLQTTEGAAWEGDYRKKFAAIKKDAPNIATTRKRLLEEEIHRQLLGISVNQGKAQEARKTFLHISSEPPPTDKGVPIIWVRNGFSEAQADVLSEIQRASTDQATVFVFVPEAQNDELRDSIASKLAAEETLSDKGQPNTEDGKTARLGIESRQRTAESKLATSLAKLLSHAQVYLAGGQEIPIMALREGVTDACEQVVDRLFPRFHVADFGNWAAVWKRAKDGNANAFETLGHKGDPDKHPVAIEILRYASSNKTGREVLQEFQGGEYGWPKDAIDATLGALLASDHLAGTYEGSPAALSNLDQRSLAKVTFRAQHAILTTAQKLQIRKLFQALKFPFKLNEEAVAAPNFVASLRQLAADAGGPAPAPEAPTAPVLIDLEGLAGNDLLLRLHQEKETLTDFITTWQKTAKQITQRLPDYILAEKLCEQSEEGKLPEAVEIRSQLDAIKTARNLIDDPSPVAPVLKSLGKCLRAELRQRHQNYEKQHEKQLQGLASHPLWASLSSTEQQQFLRSAQFTSQPEPVIGSDSELLTALQSCHLENWQTRIAALPTQAQQALTRAVKAAEPKAQPLSLPSATIKSNEDLEAWLASSRTAIEEALSKGPVIL